MKTFKYIAYSLMAMGILTIISCSRMDDYTDFLGEKEAIYPGKVDSIKVHSGKNRIAISWLLSSDPKVTRAVIYWNNMADSVEVPITRTGGIDSIGVVIPNLTIGVYNFVVFTYDKDNHKSVPVTIAGRVFGDDYEKGLNNRSIKSAYRWNIAAGPLFIVWEKLEPTFSNVLAGAVITYKDNAGATNTQLITFDPKKDTTVVSMPANIASNAIIEYSTLIKPDSIALDTFYAPKEKIIYSTVTAPKDVFFTEAVDGKVTVNKSNIQVNKADLTFTKIIDISRLNLKLTDAYSVDIELSTSGVPSGTEAINLTDVKMKSSTGQIITHLDVPAGQSKGQLYFTIPKSVLDANTGKMIAFNINLNNLKAPTYKVDGLANTTAFVIDVEEFKEPVEDVTSTYLLNTGGTVPFARADGGIGLYGTIKDWKINNPILHNNIGFGIAGFTTNNEAGGGYMYAVRFSNRGAPQTTDLKPLEGRFHQNITLPAGKYSFEVDFKALALRIESNNAIYLAASINVGANDTLPGTGLNNSSPLYPGNINEAHAYTKLTYYSFLPIPSGNTNTVFDQTVKMPFQFSEGKTIALGLITSFQNTNDYMLIRGVKLKKYKLVLFD